MRIALATILGILVPIAAAAQAPPSAEGRDLYATGGSGTVRVFGNTAPAAGFACRKCHGAFGEGGREGATAAPALAPDAPAAGAATRPALSAESFHRAVVEGLGSSGGALDPAMPRFDLDARQTDALFAHVRSLGEAERQGVEPRAAHVGVLSTTRSRRLADAYADRLRRALEAAGPIYGRRLGVRLIEAADAGAAADAAARAPTLAIVGLSAADAEALPAIAARGVPVLFPLFPLRERGDGALVVAPDADEPALFGALADRMKADGARAVALVTDAGADDPGARVAADAVASRGLSALPLPAAQPPGESVAHLLVAPFERSLGAFAKRRAGAGTRVYGIASQVARALPALSAAGLSSALAVDNMTAVRRAVETDVSVADAHADAAARLIADAATAAGRDLRRSTLMAPLRRRAIEASSGGEAAHGSIRIIVR